MDVLGFFCMIPHPQVFICLVPIYSLLDLLCTFIFCIDFLSVTALKTCLVLFCLKIIIMYQTCSVSVMPGRLLCCFLIKNVKRATSLFLPYANNKGADQPAHPRSLISTFVVCCLDSVIPHLAIAEISRLYLISEADLTWSQTPKAGFLVTRLK